MNLVPYSYYGASLQTTNIYSKLGPGDPLLSGSSPRWVERQSGQFPWLAGKTMDGGKLNISFKLTTGGSYSNLGDVQDYIKGLFDTQDATPRQLICTDSDDSNRQWYVYGFATSFSVAQAGYVLVTLALRSPVWTTVTQETESTWNVTATGGTAVFNIDIGNIATYPVIQITPRQALDQSARYKRYVKTYNYTRNPSSNYFIDVTDGGLNTAALVSGGKMLATGADIRVYASDQNGNLQMLPRWLSGINTTSTKIWAPIDYKARIEGNLTTTVDADDDVVVVTLDGTSDQNFSATGGVLLCGTEVMTYETADKTSLTTITLSTVTRGAKGTTAASHTAGARVRQIPEVWLLYGNSSATWDDNDYLNGKPVIDLSTSTNDSWVYANFAAYGKSYNVKTVDEWISSKANTTTSFIYTVAQAAQGATSSDPVELIGCSVLKAGDWAAWTLFQPFGVTTATFTGVERRRVATSGASYAAGIRYSASYNSVNNAATLSSLTATSGTAWATGSKTVTPAASVYWLQLYLKNVNLTLPALSSIGMAGGTVTLDTSTTSPVLGRPYVALNAEQVNEYPLDCTITNVTTGKSISLDVSMDIDDTLTVDTLNKTVKITGDKASALSGLVLSTVRQEWLAMNPGNNTLKFEQANTQDVDIVIKWNGRNN